MAMPDINEILRFERGEMTEDEVIEFMQAGIDSGWVWQLQGFYGRTAAALIEQGLCTRAERGLSNQPQRC